MEVAWVLCRRELALPDARVTHDFLIFWGRLGYGWWRPLAVCTRPEYVMAAMQAGKECRHRQQGHDGRILR